MTYLSVVKNADGSQDINVDGEAQDIIAIYSALFAEKKTNRSLHIGTPIELDVLAKRMGWSRAQVEEFLAYEPERLKEY